MRIEALAVRPRTLIALTALLATVGVALAARAHAAPARAGAAAVVQLRQTGLGKILVDGRGRTLYLFEADKHGKSACYGKCAAVWPPLLTTAAPKAGAGVKPSLLKTSRRRDGRLQVSYAGHPLYLFLKDARAGQTAGEGVDHFGGEWYAVSAAGRVVEDHAPGTTTTTTTTPTSTTPTTTGSGEGPPRGY